MDLIFFILVGKARECKTQSNCEGIRNTYCMIHPQDNIMRCLCGDYSAPDNGLCKNKIQGKNKCHEF